MPCRPEVNLANGPEICLSGFCYPWQIQNQCEHSLIDDQLKLSLLARASVLPPRALAVDQPPPYVAAFAELLFIPPSFLGV